MKPRPSKEKRSRVLVGLPISSLTPKTPATAEAWSKKGLFHKPLAKEFRRDGFTYRQIAREGNAAIYEQRWTGCAEPSVCYEVIRVRYRDGFHIGGRFVEPAEVYPNSESWGVDGWTVTTLDAAYEKLRALRSGQ
jgi:hypothetical protein